MYKFALLFALGMFLLDRLSKWWFLDVYELANKGSVNVLPILDFVMTWNRGVSFSMFSASSDFGRWMLVALTSAIVVGLFVWLKSVQTKTLALAIGLVIGGAIGNIYDRVVFGAVADFFHFYVGNRSFFVFNVADCGISMGAAVLVWDAFFGPQNADKKNDQAQIED